MVLLGMYTENPKKLIPEGIMFYGMCCMNLMTGDVQFD